MVNLRAAMVAVAVGIFCLTSGCGPSDQFATYPVRGTITFQGEPMAGGGSIAFLPLDAQGGKGAGGMIETDGTYALTTYEPGDGARAGEFRVVIEQVTVKEPEAAPEEGPVEATMQTVPANQRIPKVYSDVQNSPLTATVDASSANQLDFTLERK